jgi:transaldolase
VLDGLAAVGVDYDDVVRALEEDGVTRFQASWTELLHTVAAAMAQHRG